MIAKLVHAEFVQGFIIHFKFADGVAGNIDLQDELWGEVFAPLRKPEVFQNFRLDTELNTVVWPTGADLAPEYLYERALAESGSVRDEQPHPTGRKPVTGS